MNKLSVFFHTLGCPKNIVDSEVLCGGTAESGFKVSYDIFDCDVCVINTCSFIQDARQQTYDEIAKVLLWRKKEKKNFKLVVTGCLIKNTAMDLLKKKFPAVDLFVSPDDYPDFSKIIDRAFGNKEIKARGKIKKGAGLFPENRYKKRMAFTPAHYSYVKISEGCSNCCSYCTIPLIRGAHHSRDQKSILEEMRSLIGKGVKEFNLVSQDLTAFGKDKGKKDGFLNLLSRMTRLRGDFWIRLMYLHPKGVTKDLIDLIKGEKKICSYLDMPIQHINDRILREMNRKIKRRDIERIIAYGRSGSQRLTFRTTLIVGFPGETKKEFNELYDFVKETRFDHLGVFAYSVEEGTRAAGLKRKVREEEKHRRVESVMLLQKAIAEERNREKIGTQMRVLLEGPASGGAFSCWGRSESEAPEVDSILYIKKRKNFSPGQFIDVIIEDSAGYDLLGSALK